MIMGNLFDRRKQNRHINAILLLFPVFLGIMVMAAVYTGCLSSGSSRETENPYGYTSGIFMGSARGFRGSVNVQIQVSSAGIEDIVIVSHNESAYPGYAAMEELLELVLETGTTDLDAISGATFSSRGFLDAVEDALEKASDSWQASPH